MMQTVELLAGIPHGFFGRQGGISRSVYSSLNCGLGSGDDAERVRQNRARALDRLGLPPSALVTLKQVHSPDVIVVEKPFADDERPEADGLVSRSAGVALGILTADCAPVLFADPGAGVIGAAHAGWRGAKAGIIARTVAAMERLGARRSQTVATVGPCIAQPSYEVGLEFRAAFLADDEAAERFFAPAQRPDKLMFDLAGFVHQALSREGIARVSVVAADTFADADRYFSYRRTTLAGERDYGRQLSVIALPR
jgi:YfiH family protein